MTGALMRVEQVAAALGISAVSVHSMMSTHGIRVESGYPVEDVLRLRDRRAARRDLSEPNFVHPDAHLSDVLIHHETGWEVHPMTGEVWSSLAPGPPRRLGFVTNNQMRAYQNSKARSIRRQWQLGRVVWEAVNRQPVPDGWVVYVLNGDFRDIRYANLGIQVKEPILDPQHPSHGRRSE